MTADPSIIVSDLAPIRVMNDGTFSGMLYGDQGDFVKSEKPNQLYVGGIGTGKSTMGAVKALLYCARYPGIKGILGTPDYGILADSTLPALEEISPQGMWKYNGERHHIVFTNGSRIYCLSGEYPNRWKGQTVSFVWIDEVVPEFCWTKSQGRMRQRMLKYPDIVRSAFITTTPVGRNYIYKKFIRPGLNRPRWESFRMTSEEAHKYGFIDDETWARWDESYTGDFRRQELGGEFLAYAGLIFANFDRFRHMWQSEMGLEPFWGVADTGPKKLRYQNVAGGIDFGLKNPSAIVVIAKDKYSDRVYGLDEFYEPRCDSQKLCTMALWMQNKYNVNRFHADSSDPDYIEYLQQRGVRVEPADRSLQEAYRIARINHLLLNGPDGWPNAIFAPRMVSLAGEMEEYEYDSTSFGEERGVPKPNQANHAIDAFNYALDALEEMPIPVRNGRFSMSSNRSQAA